MVPNGVHRRPKLRKARVHRVRDLLTTTGAQPVLVHPQRQGEQPVDLGQRPERADRQPVLAGRSQFSESPSGVRVVELGGEKSGTATLEMTRAFASDTRVPHCDAPIAVAICRHWSSVRFGRSL